MSEPLDPSDTPLATVDIDAITALFDADPVTHTDADLNRLIGELRRRADVAAAERAKAEAEPKTKRPSKKRGVAVSPEAAALADKPIEELTLSDLL